MPTENFLDNLSVNLRDAEYASFFLNDAFESGTAEEIRDAVRHVMHANGWTNDAPVPIEQALVFFREHGIAVNTYRAAA
jgi:hypothetical protein